MIVVHLGQLGSEITVDGVSIKRPSASINKLFLNWRFSIRLDKIAMIFFMVL